MFKSLHPTPICVCVMVLPVSAPQPYPGLHHSPTCVYGILDCQEYLKNIKALPKDIFFPSFSLKFLFSFFFAPTVNITSGSCEVKQWLLII